MESSSHDEDQPGLETLLSSSVTDHVAHALPAEQLKALACVSTGFAGEARDVGFWRRQAVLRLELPEEQAGPLVAQMELDTVKQLALSADPVAHAVEAKLETLVELLTARSVIVKLSSAAELLSAEPTPACRRLSVSLGLAPLDLPALVAKFPHLTHLAISHPPQRGERATAGEPSFVAWTALAELHALRSLSIDGKWHDGRLGDEVLEGISAIRSRTLRRLSLTGCIWPRVETLRSFIERNEALSDDAEEINIHRVWANPDLFDDAMVQACTRRYTRLRRLIVGPSANGLTDKAFKYLGDNREGVRAGQHLEYMYACCALGVTGDGWLLNPESVRRNLPKLKHFHISASRHMCPCGRRGCGRSVPKLRELEAQCGVKVTDSSPHW